MWLAQFVCAPQFFKTPKGLCRHTVFVRAVCYICTQCELVFDCFAFTNKCYVFRHVVHKQALDIAYTTVNSNTAPGPSPPLSVFVGARHKPSACTDKEDRSSSGSYDLRVRFKVELRGISWEALVINAVSQLPTPFSRSQQ